MTNKDNNKRIAKNTLYLYLRTFCVMGISIFTSRIVLDALGIENYGIYNVVGGFVSMFAFLSGTLTVACQRFLSFELGKSDSQFQKIFSTTFLIHLLLAAIIIVLLESIGLWFLNYKMNISSDRLFAANCVFQCSILTFCIHLISVPYTATIIAFEKMSAFAYISIIEVTLKLAIAYLLYIINFDALIMYAVFMLIVALSLTSLYCIYCRLHFKETKLSFIFDKSTFRSILAFAGWNFIGSASGILNSQGINVLTNMFFGVTFNAARGIASQIDSAVNSFVQNFMMALNPQITKKYASQEYEYMNMLVFRGTKYACFLFLLIGIPIFIKVDYILSVWLIEVPESTGLFIRYGIIYTMCQTFSQCLYTSMLATGKIKKYQIIVGTLSLLSFPTAYMFFKLGFPCEFGYVSIIIISLACLVARLILLKEMIPLFSIRDFVVKVIFKVVEVLLLVLTTVIFIGILYDSDNFISLIITTVASITTMAFYVYTIGLERQERVFLKKQIINKIKIINGK